jgi:hypothetical protein
MRVGLGLLLAEDLLRKWGSAGRKGREKAKAVRRRQERAMGENKKGA